MVLVTYASKYGATKEIAEKISETLLKLEVNIELKDVGEVAIIENYEHVVLGSAVYIGGWQKGAVGFLKKQKNQLQQKKVWLFSSGPTGEGNPVELLKGWQYPDSLKDIIQEINPVDIKVFHGAVELKNLNFMVRAMVKKMDSPVGDFRDWDSISAWAAEIAANVKS